MATVTINIVGDARRFQQAVGQVETGLGRLGTFARRAGAVLGGVFVADKLVDFASSSFRAFEESQKVTAQTEAVITSMGGAANVTADQVAALSEKLSLQSGVDDELIQSAQNVLLTFGQVRNEIGEGNNVFDRASQAALDMSVALGTDMQSAVIQVGKALNDPIRGITALRRAGVQLTVQQEEQIAVMVEAGDVAGAQKVILAELERQFGGSAAAQATATGRLSVAWGNIQEQLGEKLAPVLERVATFLAENLPGAMDATERGVAKVVAFFKEHWPKVQAVVEDVVAVVTTVWRNFGDEILMVATGVWTIISGVIEGALKVIQGLIQTVTAVLRGDWSAAWEGIQRIVEGVTQAIIAVVSGFLQIVAGVVQAGWQVVSGVFSSAWKGITTVVRTAWNWIIDTIEAVVAAVLRAVDRMLGPIDEAIGKIGGLIGAAGRVGGGLLSGAGSLLGFAHGGIVGGPRGAPRLAVVHGGERVLTPAQQQGAGIVVNVYGAASKSDAQEVIDALNRWQRSNGPIPISVRSR